MLPLLHHFDLVLERGQALGILGLGRGSCHLVFLGGPRAIGGRFGERIHANLVGFGVCERPTPVEFFGEIGRAHV